MTAVVPALRDHRAAARAVLQAATLPGGASARTYSGKAPDGDLETPYLVVHGYPTSEFDGPATDPEADVVALIQVSSHGADPDEAEGLLDSAVLALMNRTAYAITGRTVDTPRLRTYRPADLQPGSNPVRYSAHAIVAIPTSPT